ncbi:MAG TPA: hypothetical protein VMW75_23625 [Thermoanaerobaculia bacterium]|nr:hypothetical protein [Thermoanaerobaculia bacterium]
MALVLAALLLPVAANAQALIKVNDDVWFRFGIQLQGWGDWTQSAENNGYAENLYLRRDRLLITGQVAPNVTFFFQTDDPNLGKAPKALTTGFLVQDALMEWKVADSFILGGGEFLVPFARNGLQSTLTYFTMDLSATSTVNNTTLGDSALRDTGAQIRGYVAPDEKLEYRFALLQGIRQTGSRNGFREAGFLQYNFFERDTGYVLTGTSLGKKKMLNLFAGYDGQGNYHAYNGDIFWTLPTASHDEFGGQVQWAHYDGNTFLPVIPRQNDYLAELAYYSDAAKVQPFVRWEQQKFVSTAAQKNDQTRFGGGLNYYVHGQNLKFVGQYLRIDSKAPIRNTNEFTLEMQVWYY